MSGVVLQAARRRSTVTFEVGLAGDGHAADGMGFQMFPNKFIWIAVGRLGRQKKQALQTQNDTASRTILALRRIRGIGENFAAVLTREVFYRSLENRRQIASYLALTQHLSRAVEWIVIGG